MVHSLQSSVEIVLFCAAECFDLLWLLFIVVTIVILKVIVGLSLVITTAIVVRAVLFKSIVLPKLKIHIIYPHHFLSHMQYERIHFDKG